MISQKLSIIAFKVGGENAVVLEALKNEIARRFGVYGALNGPAHVSFFSCFF